MKEIKNYENGDQSQLKIFVKQELCISSGYIFVYNYIL